MGYRNRAERAAAAARFRRSGLTRTAFAAEEGVSLSTLQRWLRESAGRASEPRAFVRLVATSSGGGRAAGSGSGIAVSANGFRIEVEPGFNPSVLAGVLVAVRDVEVKR